MHPSLVVTFSAWLLFRIGTWNSVLHYWQKHSRTYFQGWPYEVAGWSRALSVDELGEQKIWSHPHRCCIRQHHRTSNGTTELYGQSHSSPTLWVEILLQHDPCLFGTMDKIRLLVQSESQPRLMAANQIACCPNLADVCQCCYIAISLISITLSALQHYDLNLPYRTALLVDMAASW